MNLEKIRGKPFAKKVISGGQTGADRGGLEAAKTLGILTGGTAPKGYLTEKGPDPSLKDFGLVESHSNDYAVRTKQNVIASDGTLAFRFVPGKGTDLTIEYAKSKQKPYFVIEPDDIDSGSSLYQRIRRWMLDHNVHELNVAGNRESLSPGIQKKVQEILQQTLQGTREILRITYGYKPPTVPNDFPKAIGIELYNLDVSDEDAIKEFIWKYVDESYGPKDSYSRDYYDWQSSGANEESEPWVNEEGHYHFAPQEPRLEDYRERIMVADFHDILSLKPIIRRAIRLQTPTRRDLQLLNEHLNERLEYDFSNVEDESSGFEKLPDDKVGATIIREMPAHNDGRLRWTIYRWIYYAWALAIEVRYCERPGCNRIFMPVRKGQKYHTGQCRWRHHNRLNQGSPKLQTTSAVEASQRPLSSEQEAYELLSHILHPDGLHCPNAHPLPSLDKDIHDYSRKPILSYRCPDCKKTFNLFTDTIWYGSRYKCLTIVKLIEGVAQGRSTSRLAKELHIDRSHLSKQRKKIEDFITQHNLSEVLISPL